MICPSCNRNNAEGLDLCDYCGTPLSTAPAGKRKTEMEVGGAGGGPAPHSGGAPKRRTEFEAPAPAPMPMGNPFGGGDDPFAPPPVSAGKAAAGGSPPTPPPMKKAVKPMTKFDGGRPDPFAPQVAGPAQNEERYLGRRIVGWMITFDNAPDGQAFSLREGRNLLGRDADRCDIVITSDDMISGGHAVVVWRNGKARIADDKSQNGTFLNEEDVLQPEEVKDGDVVRIGRTRFICRLLDHDKVTALWKPTQS